VSFYYRQVKEKSPATPLGPHDCEDLHVRARSVRLSTSEHEVTQALSILRPQSTDQRPNKHGDDGKGGNQNDSDKNNTGNNGGGWQR
jgi:hypothetical protein